MNPQGIVAYFSMEITVDPALPTCAGGLGILAGDTLRSAADLEVAMVALTLLPRRGYFRQRLDAAGRQLRSRSTGVSRSCLSPWPPRSRSISQWAVSAFAYGAIGSGE